MGTLHTITAPPPSLYVAGERPPVANAYFAVTIDAAVDLLEAREYRDLSRPERLAKAQAEQQGFLNEFLDPGLGLALDLRVTADPGASSPVSVSLLGRVWGGTVDGASARAESLRARVRAAVPRHLTASPVEDADAVARLLSPFAGASADSAVIARHELIAAPSRPDAGVSYYYSAVPFNLSGSDWSAVYSALAASQVPVVLSVAVLPMPVPPQFAQTLLTLANYYGRLAREGEQETGPYRGRARLAPDAFAVDAEKTFHDFSRRLSKKAFGLRIQVSAARQLPPGIVEAVADAVSPAQAGGFPEHQRAAACEVRRPASVAERRLAEYNLNVINLAMLTGRQEIWGRQDPPDPQLAMLGVLGDARDASCAFRFPIAVDGTVPGLPGFPVRRGLFGEAAAYQLTGQVIRLGRASGTSRDVAVPLRSLTRHALIAGSPGSGRTTTAIEILRQLWADHAIPFLVIEPVNSDADGYRKLAAEPGFEALEVITVGEEAGAPLRFNPFEVPAGMLVGEHVTNLLACFTVAFGLDGLLPSVYLDALNLTYLRSGFLSSERATGVDRAWPTVVGFLAAMTEVTEGLGYAGDVAARIDAASVRRARQLVRGMSGSAFLTDRPGGVGRLLDHPVILELRSLGGGDEQALMMAFLLNAVSEHCRSARGASADLAHVTLVEEAHRLLARPEGSQPALAREGAAASFASALAENRKYGEGMIFTGQFPARLVADAVKNSNLKLMHRLSAEDDRRYLGEIMSMDEAQRLFAARLKTGEALLYSDELAEAAHVSIAETPRQAAARPDAPPDVVPAAAAPPFAACAPCRAQCDFRGAALSMVNDPVIVADITSAAAAAGDQGQPGGITKDLGGGLAELRGRLYDTVGRFAALPAADPGRADAAFCLFLHVHATSVMRDQPAWPAAAARLLGIAAQAPQAGERTNRNSTTQD
jgi:hypothetical protein